MKQIYNQLTFDVKVESWHSLRDRSKLCFTAVGNYVGVRQSSVLQPVIIAIKTAMQHPRTGAPP